ncbi:MAG TPA: PAS domain S-box protein [Blastocatellia bacterium]|nr:PAS domain S-box protein [Blastocatellia bacterium]
MLGWTTRLFKPPSFANDPEKTRVASLVNTISWAVILSQAFAIVVPIYSGTAFRREMIAIPALILGLFVQALVRNGWVRASGWTLVLAGWLVCAVAAFTGGGLRAPANFVFILPVMGAALLLGFRPSILLGVATVAAWMVMLVLSEQGLLRTNPVTLRSSALFANEVMFLALVTAILHMATYNMRESLRQARSELAERIKVQEALGRSEKAIRLSEERFAKAFNSSPVPMCIARDGKFLDVNDTFLQISGYARDEVVGRSGDELNIYENPGVGFDLMVLVEKEGSARNFEMNLRMKDGRIRTVLTSVEQIELGGQPSLLLAGIDISERKAAEDGLRDTEARFREFFEDSLTGDYISTPNGKLLACNPSFVRTFGFASAEDAMSCDMRILYPDASERERLLTLVREQGRVERYESQLRRRDGSPIYVVENAIGSFDQNGNLIQVKGYTFDITERRKLEQQLLQTQKIEAIGRLAGGIAHDFNNLLSIILAHGELLEVRTKGQSEPVRKDVELIRQSAQRATGLTRQLLAFSRQQVLDFRVIDLNSVVSGSLDMLGSLVGANIELIPELDPEPVTVKADASQLEQVIMNLVVNARDAMPAGGELHLKTAKVNIDSHFARLLVDAEPGWYAMLEVSDTGVGMDEQTKARIFEPFFTTKEKGKGTGLGLATVHGIVKQCDGHISVESGKDCGTTFRIFFPASIAGEFPVRMVASNVSVPSRRDSEQSGRDRNAGPEKLSPGIERDDFRKTAREALLSVNRTPRAVSDVNLVLAEMLMSGNYSELSEKDDGPASLKSL